MDSASDKGTNMDLTDVVDDLRLVGTEGGGSERDVISNPDRLSLFFLEGQRRRGKNDSERSTSELLFGSSGID